MAGHERPGCCGSRAAAPPRIAQRPKRPVKSERATAVVAVSAVTPQPSSRPGPVPHRHSPCLRWARRGATIANQDRRRRAAGGQRADPRRRRAAGRPQRCSASARQCGAASSSAPPAPAENDLFLSLCCVCPQPVLVNYRQVCKSKQIETAVGLTGKGGTASAPAPPS